MNLKTRFLKEVADRASDIRLREGQKVELKGLARLNRVYQMAWD